ncbi:MAG: hypothetical protein GXO15_02080 [Crenarchaeota archaeon]|nr:hypothetical protein [Thermoproteota archaeon]
MRGGRVWTAIVVFTVSVALTAGLAGRLLDTPSARLTVVVELPEVPGASGLHGWVEVVATAPGAKPLAAAAWAEPGARRVALTLDAGRLIEESRRSLPATSPPRSPRLGGGSAAVSVLLLLYDSRGRHYLASAVVGSYDVALARLRAPLEAARLVEENPYLVLQAGTLVVHADAFSIVNVTSLYESIVKEYYRLPEGARRGPRSAAGATYGGTRLRLPYGCMPITLDNYMHYDLQLTRDDFIVLPSLYGARPPAEFMWRLQGLTASERERVYRGFTILFSTAVYVPASCPPSLALYHALARWYDPPGEHSMFVMIGLRRLDDFWRRMALMTVGVSDPLIVRWIDSTRGRVEHVWDAPILRLGGVCRSGCTTDVAFTLTVSAAGASYYKNGLAIANVLVYPREERLLDIYAETVGISPLDFKIGKTAFITADVAITSDGDAVFIDYYIDRVTLYDKLGRPHQYWMIVPVAVFTPLQRVEIDWNSLASVKVRHGSTAYRVFMDKYFRLVGATRANYTWKHVYIYGGGDVQRDVTLDTTYRRGVETSYAGAVVGLSQALLNALVSSVAGGGAAATLMGIAGSLVSYAYDVYGEDRVIVMLKAMVYGDLHYYGRVEVVKMTPYLGYDPERLYLTSRGLSGEPYYPVLAAYFIVYER